MTNSYDQAIANSFETDTKLKKTLKILPITLFRIFIVLANYMLIPIVK